MWWKLLGKKFDLHICQRGAMYVLQQRVTNVEVGPTQLTADVRGSQRYRVVVRREEVQARCEVSVSCTCPYDDLCKHAWAAILSAGAQLDERWGTPLGRIDVVQDVLDEHDVFEATPRIHSERSPSADAPPRSEKPKTPEWKRLLKETRPYEWMRHARQLPETAAPIGERVWYAVDAVRSSQGGVMVLALHAESKNAGAGNKVEHASDIRGLRKLSLSAEDVGRISNEEDRAICALLIGAGRPAREYDPFDGDAARSAQRTTLWKVDPQMLGVIMPMIQKTGRLCWRRDDERTVLPLRWNPDAAWRLALELQVRSPSRERTGLKDAKEQECVLVPCVLRGDRRVELGAVDFVSGGAPGLMLLDGELSPLQGRRDEFNWCQGLLRRNPVRVDQQDLSEMLSELGKSGLDLEVVWPDAWGVRQVSDITPTARFTLQSRAGRYGNAPCGHVFAQMEYKYGQAIVGEGEGTYLNGSAVNGSSALVRRNSGEERALAGRLTEFGVRRDAYTRQLIIPEKKVPELATSLIREGWDVRGEKGAYRSAGEVKVQASSGIDWFEIQGTVQFGETSASIAAVLEALKQGNAFVSLGDGSLGMLPQQWLEKHGRWLGMGSVEGKGEGVRFSRAQLSLVDALLAQFPGATCDVQVASARKRLHSFDGIAPRAEPRGFQGTLRPYQREGLGWLRFLDEFGFGGCLADDMGLGKTVQLLAHVMDQRKKGERGPWLVVAPKSLVYNWAREAERFVPRLKVVVHAGGSRDRDAKVISRADIVLTTYATMRLDLDLLREVEFKGVVLDEAQAIKNHASQAAKAARLLKARRRIALTGTPVENRIDDLWSIFEFLNPGMLGGLKAFQGAMRAGQEARSNAANEDAQAGQKRGEPDGTTAMLRRVLRPFMLRRTKAVVAPELPARSEQVVMCELEGRQKTLYDSLRRHYQAGLLGRVETEGMGKNRIHVLEALLRLRQAACHPALIEPKAIRSESAKVSTLVEMLEELTQEGHKSLVFSQFTSMLGLLRAELEKRKIGYEYLDGKTAIRDRAAAVDRFQAKDSRPVFLISLKAGGTGLNLTAAGYVFLLDPWWNPAVEAQAIDRTHRIGQDKSVLAYRLIARGTVEERILELQSTKRKLAEAIVAEEDGPLASMTADELAWLLS